MEQDFPLDATETRKRDDAVLLNSNGQRYVAFIDPHDYLNIIAVELDDLGEGEGEQLFHGNEYLHGDQPPLEVQLSPYAASALVDWLHTL